MPAVSLFLVLAFAISWAIAFAIQQAGGFAAIGPTASVTSLMVYMLGPSIAAIITALIFDRGRFWDALGLRGFSFGTVAVWTLIGWVMALLVTAGSVLITVYGFGQAAANPGTAIEAQILATGQELPMPIDTLVLIQFAVALPFGILFNTVFLLISEELGWRGWLQPRLAHLGFWRMSILIGLIWGVWHAPIILMGHNYGDMGWTGMGLMVAFTVLLTPFHSLARERGGVIAASGMHGAINAVGGASLLFIAIPAWPWNGLLGVGGFIAMLAGWGVIAVVRRKPATAE